MGEKEHRVKVLNIKKVTHNVVRLRVEKPKGYIFVPGNATEVSVDKPAWNKEKRPFTFTCLNEKNYLEFTIKVYPERHGVTEQIGKLKKGDHIIIREPWGTIRFDSKGVFIAGGAGITPFIAIFRDLYDRGEISGNKLFFSNKTREDIILKKELKKLLGKNASFVLTQEKCKGYYFGRIDEKYLKDNISNFHQNFYLCGPKAMIGDLRKMLERLGAKVQNIIFEK